MWPPEYSIKKSKRAKNVSLKISPLHGLEVIIPFYYRRQVNVNKLVNDHKEWIYKNISIINKANAPILLPQELNLQALNENWKIKYFPTTSKPYCATIDTLNTIIINHKQKVPDDTTSKFRNLDEIPCLARDDIVVSSQKQRSCYQGSNVSYLGLTAGSNLSVEKKDFCKEIKLMLKKWLTKKAGIIFSSRLLNLSERFDLPFKKLNIRGQKTIWGSCDNKHTINLNYKLLFLPLNLVEHVMLHELTHTKYMNHSKRFWTLLRKLDVNCDINNEKLKSADSYIPPFINLF